MSDKIDTIEVAGKTAGLLSVVEIGLGSILHGFKIPFTGFFLSLNQGFFLARAVIKTKNSRLPFLISNVVAILKSLSPAGQRLTPMLAISAQGGLFSLGTIFLGPNFFGILLGYLLLSLWSFCQPILIYYLIFGKNIVDVGRYFYEQLSRVFTFEANQLLWILVPFIATKLLLAFLFSIFAYRLSDGAVSKYETQMIKASRIRHQRKIEKSHLYGALRDLCNPLFLISMGLMAIFFFTVEATTVQIIWALLRPIAIGFILFFLIRVVSFEKLIVRLETKGFTNFSNSLRHALDTVKSI